MRKRCVPSLTTTRRRSRLVRAITASRAHGLVCAGAFCLGDDVGLGDAAAHQVVPPDRALRILIAAVSAKGDDERRDAAVVESFSVIETCTEDWRRPPVILCCTEDCNCIGRRSLVSSGIALDLNIDPAEPAEGSGSQSRKDQKREKEDPPALSWSLGFWR